MDQDQIKLIGELQIYIEEHIHEHMTLLQLSKHIGYSPWYVDKLFLKFLSKTPMQYIKERRLTLAALKLRDEQPKIIDVALSFLFDSHEGFTRAFSKHFGISPYRYKKEYPPISLFLPFPISHQKKESKGEDTMNQAAMLPIFIQVVERPKRKIIIKRGIKAKHYFAYCEEVGCDIWGILTSVKEALYEPIGMWLPDKLRHNHTSTYVQGVEVPLDYNNKIPEGFEIITLEPQLYMIFQGPPYADEDFMEAIDSFNNAIKDFNPILYGYAFDFENQPTFQLEPRGDRGYIEAKPIKKLVD
jgi:AraC-like DNA-binding protein